MRIPSLRASASWMTARRRYDWRLLKCLIATRDTAPAREVLAKAANRILASAEAIEDPASRESFLNRIPEHRRILELAHELATGKV